MENVQEKKDREVIVGVGYYILLNVNEKVFHFEKFLLHNDND